MSVNTNGIPCYIAYFERPIDQSISGVVQYTIFIYWYPFRSIDDYASIY